MEGLSREQRSAQFAKEREFTSELLEYLDPMNSWGDLGYVSRGQFPEQGRATSRYWPKPSEDPYLAARVDFEVGQRSWD